MLSYLQRVIVEQEVLLVNDREEGMNICEVQMKKEALCFRGRHLDLYVFLLVDEVMGRVLRIHTRHEFPVCDHKQLRKSKSNNAAKHIRVSC